MHAYDGRPDCVEVRAGLGLTGDRYYGRAAHRRAAVTLFATESLDAIARELDLSEVPDPLLTRRNIVLRGQPVDQLASRPARGPVGEVRSLHALACAGHGPAPGR